MKIKKEKLMLRVLIVLFLAFIAIIAFAPMSYARTIVKVDGSSTVYPITEAVAEEFQGETRGKVRVTIGISGTGGGFKKFCTGESDVSNASRPIKPSEVALCKKNGIGYIELPIAYDGLAIVVNNQNTWVDHLTVDELKRIWEPGAQGKLTRWSEVRPGFPDKEIHLFGPGVDSGTFDYFTEAVVGESGASRGDFTASEDDNVLVQGVSTDISATGFFGLAYYEYNKESLKLVPIDDENRATGKGPIGASYDNVLKGTYQPLSRPLFIYVSVQSARKDEVKKFIEYYIENSEELVKDVGYVALPTEGYDLVLQRFKDRTTGSLFGGKGSQVGVKIEELLGGK
jgi:phosphate transport system substrate-binding protein